MLVTTMPADLPTTGNAACNASKHQTRFNIQAIADATDRAIELVTTYNITSFKLNPTTGQIHWLTSARKQPAKRGGGVNTTYTSEEAITNA